MDIRNDAVPEGNTTPKTLLVPHSTEIIREISNNLSSTDIKKLYFLCLDRLSPEQPCPETLEQLLSVINGDIDSVMLLKELLYHIKKYQLLKSLQTCKHQMRIALENEKYITQGRLSLFFVCENLENEAVQQLKCLLRADSAVTKDWEAVALEDFFRVWLRKFDDDKKHVLRQALLTMKRDNLAASLKCEDSYHIITPSCGRPCGLAVIFNHEIFNKPQTRIYQNKTQHSTLSKREGTSVDEENLCKLWTSFGFDVVVFNDKTYPLMMNILENLAKLNYSNYSAFICCILTHGDQGVVYASDNIPADIFNEVIYKFDSGAAPSLNNKPKMFFIQACQGKNAQIVNPPPSSNLQMDGTGYSMGFSNSNRDMLWVLSSIPSYMSFRDIKNGSWFVNSLVEVFEKNGTNQPVQQILNSVNVEVSGMCGQYNKIECVTQMPVVSFTTFHTLRLKKMENNSGLSQRLVQTPQQCPLALLPIYKFADTVYRI